ncbi:hypothetical protein LINGRAPRIM_LOCUS3099 [Linum grandiflorum]
MTSSCLTRMSSTTRSSAYSSRPPTQSRTISS